MKYSNVVLIFTMVLCLVSCNNYLDVNPKTEVLRDRLFEDESGFEDALTGVYITLKNINLYGQSMTITTLEHLISNWDVKRNTLEENLSLLNYNDLEVELTFSSIYGKAYNAIAKANAILAYIDNRKEQGVLTTPGKYEVIKGECLAIRAYCHFDMLRLFGPVPTLPADGTVLPYMKELTKEPIGHLSFEGFKAELFNDVTEAIKLLSDHDPIKNYSIQALRQQTEGFDPADDFFTFRDIHFNYYAAVGLKARMHLWFGEKQEAYLAATEVINATDPDETPKFPLGTSADMNSKDFQLSVENLVGVYNYNLSTTSSSLFSQGKLYRSSTPEIVQRDLYEESASDIRSAYLWEQVNVKDVNYYTLTKYKNAENGNLKKDIKMIPLIRISEMYLIATECADTPAAANQFWNAFQVARNIPVRELSATPAEKELEIIKEYRKEFFAEGQAFFAYKRLNVAKENILWMQGKATLNYVVPLPKTELGK